MVLEGVVHLQESERNMALPESAGRVVDVQNQTLLVYFQKAPRFLHRSCQPKESRLSPDSSSEGKCHVVHAAGRFFEVVMAYAHGRGRGNLRIRPIWMSRPMVSTNVPSRWSTRICGDVLAIDVNAQREPASVERVRGPASPQCHRCAQQGSHPFADTLFKGPVPYESCGVVSAAACKESL